MEIISPAFENNSAIPAKFTCDGENINPRLEISGVPEGAKSLVLIVDDPDSPTGTWIHWTVWNISPSLSEIKENGAPEGAIEGKTTFGNIGYGGPCPHRGTHRYFFKLYALDSALNLSRDADFNALEKALTNSKILAKAQLIGLYTKKLAK